MDKKSFANMTIDELLEMKLWIKSRWQYRESCGMPICGDDAVCKMYIDLELGKRIEGNLCITTTTLQPTALLTRAS